MCVCSSGRFVLLGWHNVEALKLLPQQCGDSTSITQRRGLYMWALVIVHPDTYYFRVLFFSHVEEWSRCLWSLTTRHYGYCVLTVISFPVVARDDAVRYQCDDSRLRLSFRIVLVPFPRQLKIRVHDYGFRHFIDGSFRLSIFVCGDPTFRRGILHAMRHGWTRFLLPIRFGIHPWCTHLGSKGA